MNLLAPLCILDPVQTSLDPLAFTSLTNRFTLASSHSQKMSECTEVFTSDRLVFVMQGTENKLCTFQTRDDRSLSFLVEVKM